MASRTALVLAAVAAGACASVALLGLTSLTVASSTSTASAQGQPATPIPSPEPGECIAFGDKVASERAVLGGTARITLTANVTCTKQTYPLHVVYGLDASEHHGRQSVDRMVSEVRTVIRSCLFTEEFPQTKAGIAEFNDGARVLSQLTDDPDQALRAASRVRMRDGHDLADGIDEGTAVLRRGQGDLDLSSFTELMVVVSNGVVDQATCPAVQHAASKARARGTLITTWCSGSDCPDACLRGAASGPRYSFDARQPGTISTGLCNLIDRIREPILDIKLTPFTVRDILPDNMHYVPGSAYPPPESVSADGSVVEWYDVYVPRTGVTYTLVVDPLEPGLHATNVEATGVYSYGRELASSFTFPVPDVLVLVPTPTTTSTPTPTTTSTPTPTATATPDRRPVYLPWAVRFE